MENEIKETRDNFKLFDEDGDIIKVQSFGYGVKFTCSDEVRVYRNGAIELINFLKAKFEI